MPKRTVNELKTNEKRGNRTENAGISTVNEYETIEKSGNRMENAEISTVNE